MTKRADEVEKGDVISYSGRGYEIWRAEVTFTGKARHVRGYRRIQLRFLDDRILELTLKNDETVSI